MNKTSSKQSKQLKKPRNLSKRKLTSTVPPQTTSNKLHPLSSISTSLQNRSQKSTSSLPKKLLCTSTSSLCTFPSIKKNNFTTNNVNQLPPSTPSLPFSLSFAPTPLSNFSLETPLSHQTSPFSLLSSPSTPPLNLPPRFHQTHHISSIASLTTSLDSFTTPFTSHLSQIDASIFKPKRKREPLPGLDEQDPGEYDYPDARGIHPREYLPPTEIEVEDDEPKGQAGSNNSGINKEAKKGEKELEAPREKEGIAIPDAI